MTHPTLSSEAQNLHQESIVVDLHIDPIIQQALFGYHLSDEHNPAWKPPKRRWLFDLSSTRHKIAEAALSLFQSH